MVDVQGEAAPGFEEVREAFSTNFDKYGDIGAAFALYVRGEKVVDLWGGIADTETGRPWTEDTTALVFSTTKGVTAIAAHMLAQRAAIVMEAPVVDYWPEFGAEGKQSVPVRQLLSHRVGLPVVDGKVTPQEIYDWDPVVKRLAAQRPLWKPGGHHGYHALTYGWLVGEVMRRVTGGTTVGQFVAKELSGPLGLDLWIGLPEAEEACVCRLTPLVLGDPGLAPEVVAALPADVQALLKALADPNSITVRALQVADPPLDFNSREVHAAEIPAGNGIATARALAKLYAACVSEVDGIRILDPETVDDATVEQSNGPDEVLKVATRFGSGFFIPSPFAMLLGPRSFGHAGAGGSLAFADPDAEVGFGYVMNSLQANLSNDLRTLTLIDAVRRALS